MNRASIQQAAVLLLLAVGLVRCDSASTPRAANPAEDAGTAPEDAIPVEVDRVRRESLSQLYATSATLRAERRAVVTARTAGVVRRLPVEEGDRVEKGQALAHLEDDEQQIAYDRARTTLEIRQRELERSESLNREGMVADEAVEVLRRETADAAHAAELAELNLSRTVIRAPFAGILVLRYLDVGATVSDGTPIFDIADTEPLYADINVPERHAVKLRPGTAVRVWVDAVDEEIQARIERIAPAVDPGTGTVKVTVAVPGAPSIRPGSFVRVDIVTDTHENALVVPRPALVAEGSRWLLYRVPEGKDRVEELHVRLGFEEGDRVEIAEVLDGHGPLQPGASIVVVGAPALADDARIALPSP
ncbi:MAG: efflux RND transporter periplasmic adaptor subunit [Acidobacteriota bacterium]